LILVDANLLLYASISTFSQHEPSRDWLDDRLTGDARVGLPWASLLAFLRIATNPRVFERPLPMSRASEQVEAWLSCDVAWIPAPTQRHTSILRRLLNAPGVYGNLVPDAHLAAMAIEHGLELCSTDGDFARFEGLRWSNPLVRRGR
jgi:toxin-antitoxin system PIN domain toxin